MPSAGSAPKATPRSLAPRSRLWKSLRIAAQFGRGALVVARRFPVLNQQQKLLEIQRWARQVLDILEVEVQSNTLPHQGFAGLVVCNHLSWMDVLVLQSLMPGAFVAKTEVRGWPVVGYLAQACATIFVDRSSRKSARAMVEHTAAAITQGYAVVVFPEGTSTDGSSVGSFHANIFESAILAQCEVQLLTLQYRDRSTGLPAQAAHFIGDMTLLTSLSQVMATSDIQAQLHIGERISALGHTRKSLARHAHAHIHAHILTHAHAN